LHGILKGVSRAHSHPSVLADAHGASVLEQLPRLKLIARVGTGMEKEVAAAMGWAIYATYSGTVAYVDANKIIIKLDKKPQNESKN